ncbi:hypothetical protein [Blastomonas sp. UPD001]|uniref:hypothetical protein n=1 Tax=Blastomonas sp. UPD001 TaxID=2217673 RepID=UPI0013005797|nr:hypothetical protein [Blastomonas sp. UPD001]
MRDLVDFEVANVSGASASPCPPAGKDKKPKGNNGFGNGGGDPAPGNSGKTGADKDADIVR